MNAIFQVVQNILREKKKAREAVGRGAKPHAKTNEELSNIETEEHELPEDGKHNMSREND